MFFMPSETLVLDIGSIPEFSSADIQGTAASAAIQVHVVLQQLFFSALLPFRIQNVQEPLMVKLVVPHSKELFLFEMV